MEFKVYPENSVYQHFAVKPNICGRCRTFLVLVSLSFWQKFFWNEISSYLIVAKQHLMNDNWKFFAAYKLYLLEWLSTNEISSWAQILVNGGMMVHDGFQRIRFYGHSARLIKNSYWKAARIKSLRHQLCFQPFATVKCHTVTLLQCWN